MVASVVSVIICIIVATRAKPVVPYEPRRHVPWHVVEVLAVLVVSFLLSQLILSIDQAWFDVNFYPEKPSIETGEINTSHPLIVLLYTDRRVGVMFLIGFSAIVVAPIWEEFFFRLILQGWLEAVERRKRRYRFLRRILPGLLPVLATSLLFGAVHYRSASPPSDPRLLVHQLGCTGLISILTFGFSVWFLRTLCGASARDLGFVPQKFLSDVVLGLVTFLALAGPIYLLYGTLKLCLPNHPIVDPITLTLFAIALGALYYRTHRIVPSIVLHMALNATSLAMALWFLAPR